VTDCLPYNSFPKRLGAEYKIPHEERERERREREREIKEGGARRRKGLNC
jgi:hypothetical protein